MQLLSLGLIFLLLSSAAFFPFGSSQQGAAKPAQIQTNYDREKDKTTVRLNPVLISGEKAQYHSVHITPAFSYFGHEFKKPETVDFEVQTVVKTKLKIDLYVVFVVDGETIFLSSNRSAVKRPVPGKRWPGERLVFRMPYDLLVKMTKAKEVAIKMDDVTFPLPEGVLEQLRLFADFSSNARA